MRLAVIVGWLLLASEFAGAETQDLDARVETRRVSINVVFTGQRVFLHGQVVPRTLTMLVVMEGPPASRVRLMEKGRVGPFWLGVRQFELSGVPQIYLVNACYPRCERRAEPTRQTDLGAWRRDLAALGIRVGLEGIASRAQLHCLSGQLGAGEEERVLAGYWELQTQRGLYGIYPNAVRIDGDGTFYHAFVLPPEAPEGKYRIYSYFVGEDRILGQAENLLFVRKAGLVAWLTRLAEREPMTYGSLTLCTAVFAGWLAGAVFRRGGSH